VISAGVEINEDKKNFHQHKTLKSVSPENDIEELKKYKIEYSSAEKKMSKYGCDKLKCGYSCKETKLSRNLRRVFCPISWPIMGLIALVVSVMLIMLEFAADTGFCYYNPVIPLMIVPLSTPRGNSLSHRACL
jgi:hypothetical protein